MFGMFGGGKICDRVMVEGSVSLGWMEMNVLGKSTAVFLFDKAYEDFGNSIVRSIAAVS